MIDKSILFNFLKSIDKDFNPHLSEKVDLKEYIDKILEKAYLIHYNHDGNLIGLLVLYCNDFENKKAYIPLVGVLDGFRGNGVARKMMLECLSYVNLKGFKIIGIHSNNPIAIDLYRRLGFRIINIDSNKRVYMELIL